MPEIVFPDELLAVCDDVVEFAYFGGKTPSGLALLQDWLEGKGWDQLVDQWDDMIALKTSEAPYNDDDLRSDSEIGDSTKISDQDRILYAKQWLDSALQENESHYLPSIHHCRITKSDGLSAVIGCTTQCYGQGGNVIEWHGAFKDLDAYLFHLSNHGFDINYDPDKIDNEYILKYWRLDTVTSDYPDRTD